MPPKAKEAAPAKDAKGGAKGGKDDKKEEKKDEKKSGGKDEKKGEEKKGDEKKKEEKVVKVKKVRIEAEDDLDLPGLETGIKKMSKRKTRKVNYREKLLKLLRSYNNILICTVTNVGSSQMQKIRIGLRGKAVVLMGKNTLIRKVVREEAVNNPQLEAFLPYVKGTIGFVFTNADLSDVRGLIVNNKVPAAAKSGALAPTDVFVPPGPTGLDPGQTAFFQALNIATKIARGSIEIINQVHLIRAGDKVTTSAVALLSKLNIKPFFYGMGVTNVYEGGAVYEAKVLDLSPADIMNRFLGGVQKIAALSLAVHYPTMASLPHSVARGFQQLVSISLATDFTFPEAQKFKDYLANPGAFTAPAPKAEEKKEQKGGKPEPKKKEPEPEPEEDEELGAGGLFGDD